MAGCLINQVKAIGNCILIQCVWPFVEPHVNYWWCFDSNIQGLSEKVWHLDQQILYFKQKNEEARFATETRAQVADWLNHASKTLEDGRGILLDNNIPTWNITSRYSIGKRAKETAGAIAKHINEGKFNTTADPAPQPAMEYPFHGPIVNIKSRESIEEGIIESLKKSSVYVIGICGMGGVGKTTMARRIEERVIKENLFDIVVRVTVSQTMNVTKIQNEIARSLNLRFNRRNRADQLRTRLMDAKRKIIICDDVWESLDFEKLGFPIERNLECNFETCKVLLTSRSKDTCKTIKNKEVFDLICLGEEEAWILFKDKAGKYVENLDPVAREVAAECHGLPIAIVTVGMALQDASIQKWKHALKELKQCNPTDFPQVLNHIYQSLKLSYDYLKKDSERDLFLMCCLFPEGYDIPIEQLTWCRMGLKLFGDMTNIEEPNITNIEAARNQTHTWVEELKSRHLLIAGEDKLHVKMHCVVRDVAIHIGSRRHHGFLKSLHRTSIKNLNDANCNWMSVDISNRQMEVPVLSRFPELRLLMLSSNLISNQFPDISFKGIKHLCVLSFHNISSRSLPSTLGSLANLQTLRLFGCQVENIPDIGKLTTLKILSCCKCENIKKLPREIESLKALRLLELSDCPGLETIPSGVISRLSLLEDLKIRSSFSEWGTTGNASLTELEHLRNLTCLEIEISNCTLSAQEICLPEKLFRYRIGIFPKVYYGLKDTDYEKAMELNGLKHTDYEKAMKLNLPGAVGNWIQKLAKKAEYLHLSADGSGNINLAEIETMRDLIFTDCSTVKKLVDINQNVSLGNLKSINIERCFNLKHVFSMEQVVCNDVPVTDGCIEFSKLKKLRLGFLPNLTAFCQGLEDIIIKFPNLTQIDIEELPKLKSLFPPYSKTVENTCFHLFFLLNSSFSSYPYH